MHRRGARLVDREQRERRDRDEAQHDRRQPQDSGDGKQHSVTLDSPMDALAECTSDLLLARERLIAQLREHALQIGEVTLTSGARAQYYVDVKRAILRPAGFAAAGALPAAQVCEWGGTAVGGMTMGADPLACAALAAAPARRRSSCAGRPRPTACSGASRGRASRRRTAAWWSRTWSPPGHRRWGRSTPCTRPGTRSVAWSACSTGSPARPRGSRLRPARLTWR